MKSKLLIAIASVALTALCQGAVTFNFSTHTGSANGPNGLPFVDGSGKALLNSTNSLFVSIGRFSAMPADFSDILSVMANFIPLDDTPLTPIIAPTNRNGLVNGPDYSSAGNLYPVGFVNESVYILVGNKQSIKSSDAFAVLRGVDTNGATTFLPGDGLGNRVQSFSMNSLATDRVLAGTVVDIAADGQPLAGSTFVKGIALVPETSTALLSALGALGLLRRRR